MKVIVVTGGIGSGKSEVCRIIQERYGCGLYEADERVKALYDNNPVLLDKIEDALSQSFRDSEGKMDRSMLAERIFGDRAALETVESLVFPALLDDFKEWSRKYVDDAFVLFESATILEKPQLKGFGDFTILVDAPFGLRLQRACERDGAGSDQIRARMMNQPLMNAISDGTAVPDADAVISNAGSYEDLTEQVVKIIDNLLNNR